MLRTIIQTEFCRIAILCGVLSLIMMSCQDLTYLTHPLPLLHSFDASDQGWHVDIGAVSNFSAKGGHPGGYLAAEDKGSDAWYYLAPDHIVEEAKKGYGKMLIFELEQSATDAQYDADDLILTDGVSKLTYNTAYNPDTTWTPYFVKLDELSGWKKGRVAVTKTEVQQVLKNLKNLQIRGEFRSGPDHGGLDNVSIR